MATWPPQAKDASRVVRHPAAWLFVATAMLLLGQAAAAIFPTVPAATAFGLAAPLLLCIRQRTRRWGLLLLVGAIAFGFGYTRHRQLLDPVFEPDHLRSAMQRAEELYLEGTLIREPEKLPHRTRWNLRVERVWHPHGAEEISGDMLVTVRSVLRQWRYGDRLRFKLKPVIPRNSGNPGGFDYATYLARREIYAVGFLDSDREVELVARRPAPLRGSIESLRREIRIHIDRHFSPSNGALLKALVIGDMSAITQEMRGSFTAAGVNHVLSISGLHVAMLGLVAFALIRWGGGMNTYLLLRWNLLKVAAFFSFLAVVFYTAIAGAMVPTVRSAIMIGVYQLAVLLDREEEVFTSLALAALLVALAWPGVVADISFQLSFLAVLFIVWGMRRFMTRRSPRKEGELPQERSWLRAKVGQAAPQLMVPLLATIGTGPLIAHYFGHLSLAGFIANPLVVPLVGFVVVPLGLTIGFLALVAPAAAAVLVWPTETILSFTLWLVDLLARMPLAHFAVPAPNPWEVAGLYLLIFSLFGLRRARYALAVGTIVAAAFCADAYYWWHERWARKELRVTHLNVGQGDAAVVEFPGSKVLVIDAGGTASGDFDPGEAIVAPFLRSRKILKVDYLLVTHARIDHYGGMRAIVNQFAAEEFWSGAARGETRRFAALEQALQQSQTRRVELHASEPCREIEGVKLCVLYPPANVTDDRSVVLRLDLGKIRFLFAGDIDKRDEAALSLNPGDIHSAVVKSPRHGAASANSKQFLTAVRPKLAVISAGARGRMEAQRDEVSKDYRQLGAEVMRTDLDGAIIIESDGETVRYRGYKSGKTGAFRF